MMRAEKTAFGSQIKVTPVPGLEAKVEIRERAGRKPDVRLWFDGTPATKPLTMTDAYIWLDAVKLLLEAAAKKRG